MKGWSSVSAGVAAVMLAMVPAMAQSPTAQTPPAQTLHQPSAAERAKVAEPMKPPTAAPRAPVQQGTPFKVSEPRSKTVLAQSVPGGARKPPAEATPVVSKPVAGHAHKPGAPAGSGKSAAAPPAVPKAVEAPKPPEPPPPAAQPARPAADLTKGSVTGLALPRWASLRSDEVNLRTGPGTRYPIEWVYRRRDLPVQIEREFEVWRLIEDEDGVKGWVHQATLTGRRSVVVKDGEHVLRRSAADDAPAVARLKQGVLGRVRVCDAKSNWCEVQVGDYRGFLRRNDLYGIYPDEAVN